LTRTLARWLRRSVPALLAPALIPSAPAHAARGAARDDALLGCWRSQVQVSTFADGRQATTNVNCVTEFRAGEAETTCAGPRGPYRTTSSYRIDRPGHYVATITASTMTKERPPPIGATYRIDERWLRIALTPPKGDPKEPARPRRVETLAVRVPRGGEGGACEPLPPPDTRVGNHPQSSIALAPPPGFTPLLKDVARLPEVAKVVGSGFLVGMFVRADEVAAAASSLEDASMFVLVVDDTRAGARPTKPSEFPAFKERVRKELAPQASVSCETERTICFDLASQPAPLGLAKTRVTSGFANVDGRLVIVHVAARGAPEGRRALDAMLERLLSGDPR
jgi:hypothetical protein